MSTQEKVKENLARRMLARRMMWLSKCAARDKAHVHFGLYRVFGPKERLEKVNGAEWNSLEVIIQWMEQSQERKVG
jgi:hypothetical protein